jgi:heme/copper-type cytochrome/quinol oxidase subunit 4
MKDSSKYNVFALALLVLLTAASGLVAFGQNGRTALVLLLSVAACAKVLLVFWQFMEMKKSHRAWLVLLGVVLLFFTAFLIVFDLP